MNGHDEFGNNPATPGNMPGDPAAVPGNPAAMPGNPAGGAYAGATPPPPYAYTGAGSEYGAPPPPGYAIPPAPGLPNPATALVLGFIPGVGAMYNGQFAKGVANIAIFAVLVSLTDHASGIFGMFVAGWVAFMVFDAYQTARARRFGLPLPNPFGLNDIGERLGFGPNAGWHTGAQPPYTGTPTSQPTPGTESFRVDPAGNVYAHRSSGTAQPYPPSATAAGGEAYSYSPVGHPAASGPVNYAEAPGGYAAAPGAYAGAPGPYASPYASPAYAVPPGYAAPAGYPPPPAYDVPPLPDFAAPPPFDPALNRPKSGLASVPAGALWLIGLGLFALLGSLHRFYFINGEFTGALFLIAFAAFLAFRRWQTNTGIYTEGTAQHRWALINSLKGASFFLIAGLLTLLESVHIIRWDSSWPFLLIFIGVWILVERMAYNRMAEENYVPSYAPSDSPAPTASEPAQTGDKTGKPTGTTSFVPSTFSPIDDKEGR